MTIAAHSAETKDRRTGSPLEVLLVFLRLGVTCFGGPIAHIGYFRDEIRLAAQLARRAGLRRSRGSVPVSAWPRQQPGRIFHRPDARRLSRRSRGVDGIVTCPTLTYFSANPPRRALDGRRRLWHADCPCHMSTGTAMTKSELV